MSVQGQLSIRMQALEEENKRLKDELANYRRLKLDLRTSIDELIQVQKLSSTIAATLDLDAVITSLADISRQIVNYKTCGVFLLKSDNSGFETLSVIPPSEEFENKVRFHWEEGILNWVLEQDQITILPDIETSPLGSGEEQNFVIAPLSRGGKTFGFFILYTDRPKETFTNQEITLLSVLTNQTAIAVENSRLYRKLEQANQRLRQSQSQLIESEKMVAVGQLATGIAHEINNPLQVILSKVQLLLIDFKRIPELRKGLKLIQENTLRIARITRALADFADQSHTKSERALVNINSLIEKVASLVVYQLRSNRIKLVVETQQELPSVRVDANSIERVCLNLISNARYAMPEGGKLTIRTGSDGEYVYIEFIDTGVGIPEKDLPRIFEPFFTTRATRGNPGLGLSVSYGIIRRQGGTIEVQSRVGEGSTFTVRLPVDEP